MCRSEKYLHPCLHSGHRRFSNHIFDLSLITSLGAFFYLVMDILIHWDVYKNLRDEINAKGWVMLTAIAMDILVLSTFTWLKWQSDPMIVSIAVLGMVLVFGFESIYLRGRQKLHRKHGAH